MFGHMLKYGIKSLLRTKEVLFWSLIFPIALATFMYLAFGKLFDTTEAFHAIPAAVVYEKENEAARQMLEMISAEGENQLLEIQIVEKAEAEQLLKEGGVEGILFVGDSLSLKVSQSGIEQTLLKSIADQFVQYQNVIADVIRNHPENMQAAVSELVSQTDYYVEQSLTDGNQDNVINYFYCIFAMTCLFACYAACDKIIKLQPDLSVIGQRRNIAPSHKFKNILVDFTACELLQYFIVLLLFVFMKFVLRLDLGQKTPAILLLLFVGTSYGIMLGIFIGSLPRLRMGTKIGILTGVSLVFCAMSDLMAQGIKDAIEHTVPVLNDINPAALITDAFYALNVYDNYERFGGNIRLLAAGAAVLMAASYFMVRRTRYASL